MSINSTEINSNGLIGTDFLKNHNNIYITDDQINILKKYDIDINNYNNIKELIFAIEDYLNNSYEELSDLEWLSEKLSEYNYYNNTNK